MKVCNRCKLNKHDGEFAIGSGRCKECQSELSKRHYRENKERYIATRKKNRTLKLIKRWRLIKELYEEQGGCAICGNENPLFIDFHHRDPGQKEALVSSHVRNASDEVFLSELEKCDLVCKNCHVALHYEFDLNGVRRKIH